MCEGVGGLRALSVGLNSLYWSIYIFIYTYMGDFVYTQPVVLQCEPMHIAYHS